MNHKPKRKFEFWQCLAFSMMLMNAYEHTDKTALPFIACIGLGSLFFVMAAIKFWRNEE